MIVAGNSLAIQICGAAINWYRLLTLCIVLNDHARHPVVCSGGGSFDAVSSVII